MRSRRAAGAPRPRTPASLLGGTPSYDSAMADETGAFDPLETPRCPIHPTDRLVIAGSDPEGRDARWECPVQGCVYSQLT